MQSVSGLPRGATGGRTAAAAPADFHPSPFSPKTDLGCELLMTLAASAENVLWWAELRNVHRFLVLGRADGRTEAHQR
jgi:hypothetical protein